MYTSSIHALSNVCTYCDHHTLTGKLAARSLKVAYYMLHKLGGGKQVQPGDRVALVFRPDEATQFATAFYGCIFAAVIPVAIEPPITREVDDEMYMYKTDGLHSLSLCRILVDNRLGFFLVV